MTRNKLMMTVLSLGLGIITAGTFLLFFKMIMASSILREDIEMNGELMIALSVTGARRMEMDYSNISVGTSVDGACYGGIFPQRPDISLLYHRGCVRFPEAIEITPPLLDFLIHHHELQGDFGVALKAIRTANEIISGLLWQVQMLACAVFFLVGAIMTLLYFAFTMHKLCELQGELRDWMRVIGDALRAIQAPRGPAQHG